MDSRKKPGVSVLMAVYNGRAHLREAVESILNQTLRNFEFIIIDDGSRDGSERILAEYARKDKRIRLIRQKNRGLAKSLNRGIGIAKGEYVARMDADDIAMPERLEIQADYLTAHPLVALCGTYAEEIDGQGRILKTRHGNRGPLIDPGALPTRHEDIRNAILRYNPFLHPTVMMRKEVVEKTGGYDESFSLAQDYDLFIRIAGRHRTANLPRKLLRYRRSCNNPARTREQERMALRARLRGLRSPQYRLTESWKLAKPALMHLVPATLKARAVRWFKDG